jgi:hypothetical protein
VIRALGGGEEWRRKKSEEIMSKNSKVDETTNPHIQEV